MPKSIFRRLSKKFFIITNGVLALFFLVGCYARWFPPQTWWPVGFLTLGSFYLLISLLLFIIFWFFAKPRWSLISIVSILLAAGPVTNMIPLRLTAGFDIQKKDSATRIMSWNVEHFDILEHKTHPERKQEMLDLVNEYQPDIACFQEMVGSDSFPKAINYIPDFLQKLGFKDYNYSYNVKVDFDGNHHFGIITFSRYPIINKQTVSYPPHDYNSIFQFTDILKGADTIRVFNIHLQSLKFSSGNLEYIEKPTLKDEEDIEKTKGVISKLKTGFLKRGVQAGRIRKAIDESPYPVIVCGDFNDVPNSYAYNTIGQNLQNAFEKKGSGLGRTFTGISPTLRIDNVFVPTNYEVLQYKRVMKKLSDHFPVLTDIIAGKK